MVADTEARRESARSKRSHILSTAIEKFGQVGYEQTKWASVAGEVGIGQTALYHYFESKAHCLLTIMRLELADSVDRFVAATENQDDPEQALRAAVAGALAGTPTDALQRRILQSHMDLLTAPRQSEKEEAERLRSRELVQEIEQNWAGLVSRGMDAGVFIDGDPRLLGQLILGMIVSIWRWYRPQGDLSLAEITDTISTSVVRLLVK